jgi:hypothetical protein
VIFTPDDEYDREELDDLGLAIRLLAGVNEVKVEGGLSLKRYLTDDEEFVALKAIARLLRNQKPFDTALRRQLAALFDPEREEPPYSSPDAAPMERRLVFRGRHHGGAKIQNRRKLEIAIAVDDLRRENLEISRGKVIEEIAERFGVDERTVEGALAHLNSILKASGRKPVQWLTSADKANLRELKNLFEKQAKKND